MERSSEEMDEHLQFIGEIFENVGISAVIWGADALIYHDLLTVRRVSPG